MIIIAAAIWDGIVANTMTREEETWFLRSRESAARCDWRDRSNGTRTVISNAPLPT
jgi:hypothetical protein